MKLVLVKAPNTVPGLWLLSLSPSSSSLSLLEKYKENIEQKKVLNHPMGEAEILKGEKFRSQPGPARDPLCLALEAAPPQHQDLCLPLLTQLLFWGLRCFSDLTSMDNAEVVLTSTSFTPWCCLVTCAPWTHKSSTDSAAFAQDQSAKGLWRQVSTEMGGTTAIQVNDEGKLD